jgi:hypothetical protein
VNPLASDERRSSPSLRGICAVNDRKFKIGLLLSFDDIFSLYI